MSVLAEAIAVLRQSKGPVCGVTALLEKLPPDQAADLRTFLDDRSVYATTIAEALKSLSHDIGSDAVRRHRNGACSCPRS